MYQPRKRRFRSSITWISPEFTSMVPPVCVVVAVFGFPAVDVVPAGAVAGGGVAGLGFAVATVSRCTGTVTGGVVTVEACCATTGAGDCRAVSGATAVAGGFCFPPNRWKLPRFCVNHH